MHRRHAHRRRAGLVTAAAAFAVAGVVLIQRSCSRQPPPTPPPSTLAPARFCEHNRGYCELAVPVPAGSSCTCHTPTGPVAGFAR